MSLIFLDSFKYYDINTIDERWHSSFSNNNDSISSISRYPGGNSWTFVSDDRGPFYRFEGDANGTGDIALFTEIIFGIAYQTFDRRNTIDIIGFTYDDLAQTYIPVTLNKINNVLRYVNNTSTVTISQDAVPKRHLSYSDWNFIEGHIGFHPSTGFVKLVVNNEPMFHITGVNTNRNNKAGITGINGFYIADRGVAGSAAGGFGRYTDIYIINPSDGIYPTGFLGDCYFQTHYATGNGSLNQFNGSDGNSTNNYELIDDSVPDGDSTYVESSGIGNQDLYTFENLDYDPENILAAQITSFVRKLDSGPASGTNVVRIAGTTYTGTKIINPTGLTTSYDFQQYVFALNPSNGSGWKKDDINNIEAGNRIE